MSREDPQMKIRLPADLKDSIEAAAKELGRSMNAEIVARLKSTENGYIDADGTNKMLNQEIEHLTKEIRQLRSSGPGAYGRLSVSVEEQVKEVMRKHGLDFDDALLLAVTKGAAGETGVPIVILQVALGATIAEVRSILKEIDPNIRPDTSMIYEQAKVEKTKLLPPPQKKPPQKS